MAKQIEQIIDKFYGGIQRDDKSRVQGACSNIEEIDIFSNENFFQAEQIFTSDTLPASSEAYAYTADNDDTVWIYGKETSGNKIRLMKVTTGGADNPGAVATEFTSADTTDVAYTVSPIEYFRQDNGTQNFLYYMSNASGTVKLRRFDIDAGTESETDSASTSMTLSGLDGAYDRTFMKVIFGDLYIGNGQYVAKVDGDGVYTDQAFTLPNGWEVVDITEVSDVALILARNINRKVNYSKGFWWDLTQTEQFDDSFDIPMGGPQWITKFKEQIIMCFANNGQMRFFTLSGAFPGAVPVGFLGVRLDNVASDATTTPVSQPKTLAVKEDRLFFAVNKTDKTGVYSIGKLDDDKPFALTLAKRYGTTDYADHTPYALFIQGPNYYGAFDDNGTNKAVRCESNNDPARSSNAVYESIWLDADEPFKDKQIVRAYLTSYPLAASTSATLSIATDYSSSYTQVNRPDNSVFNTPNGTLGFFRPKTFAKKKVYKAKVALTSNGTDTPKITTIGFLVNVDEEGASN